MQKLRAQHRVLGRMIDWYLRRLEANPHAEFQITGSQQDSAVESRSAEMWLGAFHYMQNIRFRRTLKHAAHNSPYYREKFANAALNPADIGDIDDVRQLPYTTPDDLRDSERFLSVPQDRIAHVFTTCGTSKRPKKVYLTREDFDRTCNLVAAMNRAGLWGQVRPVCMLYKQQGLWGSSNYVEAVISRLGGISLPIGVPPLDETIELIEEFQPNMLATNPCYMAALTRHAQCVGFRHELKAVTLGGEIVTEAQASLFREYWGAEVWNGYGLLEMGGVGSGGNDCDALHFNLVQNLPEIIDPETGEPANEGELVLTTLVNEAMPLIRYRTRDRCRRVACRCGWDAPAFQVVSRMNDSVVICANNIHGPVIADGLSEIEPRLTGLEISADHVKGIDRLTLRIEVPPESSLREQEVQEKLFRVYPVLGDEYRVDAYELSIDIQRSPALPAKFLRVRDLRQ